MHFARQSRLANSVIIPILKELPDGIEYGTNLLAEFEPNSIWYDASLTMAAQSLRNGIKTDYHTFQRKPSEVSHAIANFGLDAQKLVVMRATEFEPFEKDTFTLAASKTTLNYSRNSSMQRRRDFLVPSDRREVCH
jgi:hypothetical protein